MNKLFLKHVGRKEQFSEIALNKHVNIYILYLHVVKACVNFEYLYLMNL